MYNVFIDGKEGTTGLQIFERLGKREDIKIISLPEELRKDPAARKEAINASDVTFLCLPDEAAKQSVSFVESDKVKVIDASTAHRTNPMWAYGFAELSKEHRNKIATSNLIANPGCYASGFIALVYPLIQGGIAGKEIICHYRTSHRSDTDGLSFDPELVYSLSNKAVYYTVCATGAIVHRCIC